MGDFNLNANITKQKSMLERICNEKKSVLKEVTTEKLNQLDYIFIDERMIKISYSTSYENFISDHKSITI